MTRVVILMIWGLKMDQISLKIVPLHFKTPYQGKLSKDTELFTVCGAGHLGICPIHYLTQTK